MEGWPAWAPQWLQDGWAELARIWSMGVFGMTYGQIFSAVGIMLLALLLRGFVARTIVRWITAAASGTKTNLDDALVKAISEPLKLVPVIIGVYVAMSVMEVSPEWHAATDKVMQSLIAVAVFWTLNRAVGAFAYLLGAYQQTLGWMIKALQVLFIAMGVAAVLQIWSVPILPVIGGLGIFGVALAFGAQDLVKNIISGIFILVEKRFTPGEWIEVPDVVEGIVEQIGFRSTIIRQLDKTPVYVPNAMFSDNTVKNYSRMSHRRIRWSVGLEYRSSLEQLRYVRDEIEAYLWTSEDFAQPPDANIIVRIDTLGESSIDILVVCFTKVTRTDAWLEAKEKLAQRVMEIVKAAGTDFAFPSRTVYMQATTAPEPFTPPAASPAVAEAKRLRLERQTKVQEAVERLDDGDDDDD